MRIAGPASRLRGFAAEATIARRMEIAVTWRGTCTCVANPENRILQPFRRQTETNSWRGPRQVTKSGHSAEFARHSHRQRMQALEAICALGHPMAQTALGDHG